MDRAACIRCGLLKTAVSNRCPRCGLDPRRDDATLARSIRLSTRYQMPDGDYQSVAEVEGIGKAIEAGHPAYFDDAEITQLLDEKRLLDEGLSVVDRVKVYAFILMMLLPTVVGLYFMLR